MSAQRQRSHRAEATLEQQLARIAAVTYPFDLPKEANERKWEAHLLQERCQKRLKAVIRLLEDSGGKHDPAKIDRLVTYLCSLQELEFDVEKENAMTDAFIKHLTKALVKLRWHEGHEVLCVGGHSEALVVSDAEAFHTLKNRHIPPAAVQDNFSNRNALVAALRHPETAKVVVLYGSSGAGKTMAGVLLGCLLPRVRAVVYCLCSGSDVRDAARPGDGGAQPATGGEEKRKRARNAQALRLVVGAVKYAIHPSNRHPPQDRAATDADGDDMVLVLDELGGSPDMVRGIIAQPAAVRDAVKDAVKCTGHVHIVIVGTGAESASHDVGSLPENFAAFHMREALWPVLRGHIPKPVRRFVDNGGSPTAALIRALVTNARCAALFVEEANTWFKLTGRPATEESMKHAAAATVGRYRGLNRLGDLSLAQVVGVIGSAMAAQLSNGGSLELTADLRSLKVSYGVLVDHGEFKDDRVEPPAGRPRYEVEPAFEAMLQLAIGMGHRPPSGEGFEQAFADFAAMAVAFAGLTAAEAGGADGIRRSLFCAEGVRGMLLTHCGAPAPPHGWAVPLEIVSWLQAHGLAQGHGLHVGIHQAASRIEPWRVPAPAAPPGDAAQEGAERDRHYDTVRRTLAGCVAGRPPQQAVAMVNDAHAAWADVLLLVRHRTFTLLAMCRTKMCAHAPLPQHALLFELHKMGCTAEVVLAGAWAHTVRAVDVKYTKLGRKLYKRGRVLREELVAAVAERLHADAALTFETWLREQHEAPGVPQPLARPREAAARARLLARCEQEQLLEAASASVVASTASFVSPAGGGGRHPPHPVRRAFVVAAFGGVAALTPAVDTLLKKDADVLLLHAPAEDVDERDQRLRGFYPVRVEHDGTGVRACEVPAAMDPRARTPYT
jgi:hypothetical protein